MALKATIFKADLQIADMDRGYYGGHALTLAPCAPAPQALEASACYYQPQTRFGRHGNLAAMGGRPFKRPVIGLRTAAFLTFCQCRFKSDTPFRPLPI